MSFRAAVESGLPDSVKISLRTFDTKEILIRFTNLDEKNAASFKFVESESKKNAILSALVGENVTTPKVKEVGLSANQNLKDIINARPAIKEYETAEIKSDSKLIIILQLI